MDQEEQLRTLDRLIDGPELVLAAHLEDLVKSQGKQKRPGPLLHLIIRAGIGRPEPVRSIRRALEQLKHQPTPKEVIRHVLETVDRELGVRLVPALIGDSLLRRQPKDAKDRRAGPPLRASAELLDDLQEFLGVQFSWLGPMIWDESGSHRMRSGWCAAWADFSLAVLCHAHLLRSSQTRVLASRYVERIATVPTAQADGVAGLLLYLDSEFGPFEEQVFSVLRESPVTARLQAQVSRLAGGTQTKSTVAAKLPEASAQEVSAPNRREEPATVGLLGRLPDGIAKQILAICEIIRGMTDHTTELQKQLEDARSRETAVKKDLEERKATCQRLEKDLEQASAEKEEFLEQIERVRQRNQELSAENDRMALERDELRQTLQTKERELTQTKEDYTHLENRAMQEREETGKLILQGLASDLRNHCEMLSGMLKLVARKERDARYLIALWNEMDETLWKSLRLPGFPVQEVDDGTNISPSSAD